MELYAVILCGGRGERFWPRSRRSHPKQFVNLFGRRSLLAETSERIRPLCPKAKRLFVAPAEFGKLVQEQVRPANGCLLLEPEGRNTAPAIGLAAAYLSARAPDATMVVLPADHFITENDAFLGAVRFAAELAQEHLLVTFGIEPSRSDTGYGYINIGPRIRSQGELAAHRVRGFCEKPDGPTATRYVASGEFLWNSGMFVWRVDAIMDAFRRFLPELGEELSRFADAVGKRREKAAMARIYRNAAPVSIDYGVMEKAENIAVVRPNFGWDDLGSWPALARHLEQDEAGNVKQGQAVLHNSRDCVVVSDSGLIATLGVKDLVIVRAGDVIFVAHRDELDGMKAMLKRMAEDREMRKLL